MEEKTDIQHYMAYQSIRVAYLLEEVIFQQILSRNPDFTMDQANEKFAQAMQNVKAAVEADLQSHGFAPDRPTSE